MNQLGKKRNFIKPKKQKESTFLLKLYTLLNDKDNKYSNYIHWCKNGFIITNLKNFIKYVLPDFFKDISFFSFVRQLNLYDFHKVKTDKKEEIKYIHEQFSKDKSENEIKLIKKKKKKVSQIKNTDIPNRNIVAPDFNFIQAISNDLLSNKSIKIEKIEEPKIYEFKNIIQQSDISKITNQKILNYLLDNILQKNNYQKKINNEINNLTQLNIELIKQLQICHNKIINQNNNLIKMKTYILKLLLNKYKFNKYKFNKYKFNKYKFNNKVIINKNNNKIFDIENSNKIIKNDNNENEKYDYRKEKKPIFDSLLTVKTITNQNPEDSNNENQYEINLSYLSPKNPLDLESKLFNSKNNFNFPNNIGESNFGISINNSIMNLSKVMYINLNNSFNSKYFN